MSPNPFEVRLGAHAEGDLIHVAAWYAERHASGIARFIDAFTTAQGVLSIFPLAGREREEIRSGLRSYVVYPYVVFYRVNERSRAVTILRVIHGHRDIDTDDFEEA